MGEPVGTSLETSAALLQGRQQRNAFKTEAAQLRSQKKAIETNAALSQAERMRKLQTILAAQNAAFAMTGQTAGVGSANAIQAASIDEANREARIEKLQTDLAKKSLDFDIWSAKKASRLSMATSMMNFGFDLASRQYAATEKGASKIMEKIFSSGAAGGE